MSGSKFTPGPWGLRGVQIRADNGRGAHVATWQISRADGVLIAAAPELLALLALACEAIDRMNETGERTNVADTIRAKLEAIGVRFE